MCRSRARGGMHAVRSLLLVCLMAMPLVAGPPVDVDVACQSVCGDVAGTTVGAPTQEEIDSIQMLALARIRQMVTDGTIKTWWFPMNATELWWMQAPGEGNWTYRTPVSYCSRRMSVYGDLAGVPQQVCATGIAYKDRLVISLSNPANVRALIFWEAANNYFMYRLGREDLTDRDLVSQITAWGMATISKAAPAATGKALALKDIKAPAPAPESKKAIE